MISSHFVCEFHEICRRCNYLSIIVDKPVHNYVQSCRQLSTCLRTIIDKQKYLATNMQYIVMKKYGHKHLIYKKQ